jgi:hypothetical protein
MALFMKNFTEAQIKALANAVRDQVEAADEVQDKLYQDALESLGATFAGDIFLNVSTNKVNIPAVVLNAADAYGVTVRCTATLEHEKGLHTWAGFAPVVTTSKGTVQDGYVSAPSFPEDIHFMCGRVIFIATLDTGNGKTYVAGENVSVTVRVNADDMICHHTIDPVTVEINII